MNPSTKVICLGKEFNSEEERREYFRNELRAKLSELKKIEGFPIGEDEDIINLSDPPYYTACPNPWLNDFIAEWEKEKEHIPGRTKDFQVDEPYASDVSEGKINPIYNAHTYHTKVPHPAIMRYILHYTQPGDTVLDAFSGTGMTGVASQFCGSPDAETKYRIEKEFKNFELPNPKWGNRKAILNDLSPIASFISYNYNTPVEIEDFGNQMKTIISEVEKEFGWMYETLHNNHEKGKINFTVWSDVFSCPRCSEEIVFWEAAIDKVKGKVLDIIKCPKCNAELTKKELDKLWITKFDYSLQKSIKQTKSIPVLINYTVNKKTFSKTPNQLDLDLIKKIEEVQTSNWFPIDELPHGFNTQQPIKSNGLTHSHHFYTSRNRALLASFYSKLKKDPKLLFCFTAPNRNLSKMSKIGITNFFHGGGGPINAGILGTLYIPSFSVEYSVLDTFKTRFPKQNRAFSALKFKEGKSALNQVGSAISLLINSNSIDYIFTDPPFGGNLMYSELNFLWESWLKTKTNNKTEAIENSVQGKSLLDYQSLMEACFNEYYRVLKPGKWMTVEFSNTSAAVWNGIQTSLQRAGFILANVAALDKKQGSFKAVTTPTAVKQDLVISCYKPSIEFEQKFKSRGSGIALWEFVSEHLQHLPVHVKKENSTTAIVERSPKIIFDRLITFYLMRGLPVPIDARDFQDGLKQRFVERDGMYFTSEQAAEYDEKKSKAPQFVQLSLVVTNESDAIEWLKDRLRKQAQKYQDIMPEFRIATQSLRKGDTLPELQDILNESFIQESDGRWRTPNPNESKDREALRNKVLIKEFNGYVVSISQPKAKKLKEVRVEALRAGFKNCWEQKDFKTIVSLGDMIPKNILLEDEQLLMYYDIAKDRI
jgi:DNA modification methylase